MSTMRKRIARLSGLVVLCCLASAPLLQDKARPRDSQIGESFRVPYRRTLTNHYLVRARINGKGPFNFLVDTGAPALFISTEAAKKAGLEPPKEKNGFWSAVDRFEIEGGIDLRDIKGVINDPFQLQGMNALGLPGATIDGILGFTILARFRMEFDPRSDRLVWTRLDYEPKDPYVPTDPAERQAPPEMAMLNALGPLLKGLALFTGKQPEDALHPQGLIGLVFDERDEPPKIAWVLPGSPADRAGLRAGDVLLDLSDQAVSKRNEAHGAIARIKAGDPVKLKVRRGSETLEFSLRAAEGL